ncbi:unnamed protein product [Amoebophrya sp. A25]|nr:unnamed protein product [Amoebophrya sp. A25]|eukprot:GSA25T00002384001.1
MRKRRNWIASQSKRNHDQKAGMNMKMNDSTTTSTKDKEGKREDEGMTRESTTTDNMDDLKLNIASKIGHQSRLQHPSGLPFGMRLAFQFCHNLLRRKGSEAVTVPCVVVHVCFEFFADNKDVFVVDGLTPSRRSSEKENKRSAKDFDLSTPSSNEEDVRDPEDGSTMVLSQADIDAAALGNLRIIHHQTGKDGVVQEVPVKTAEIWQKKEELELWFLEQRRAFSGSGSGRYATRHGNGNGYGNGSDRLRKWGDNNDNNLQNVVLEKEHDGSLQVLRSGTTTSSEPEGAAATESSRETEIPPHEFWISTAELKHYKEAMHRVCASIPRLPLKALQPMELVILLSYDPKKQDKYAFFVSLLRYHGVDARSYFTNELVGLYSDVLPERWNTTTEDNTGAPKSMGTVLLDLYFAMLLEKYGGPGTSSSMVASSSGTFQQSYRPLNTTQLMSMSRRRKVRHLLIEPGSSGVLSSASASAERNAITMNGTTTTTPSASTSMSATTTTSDNSDDSDSAENDESNNPFPLSEGLCLGIADCFVRKKWSTAGETSQCEEDRHFVFHHPASKKFLQSPMTLLDLLTLLKYNVALALKGVASHDLTDCDVRYYIRANSEAKTTT